MMTHDPTQIVLREDLDPHWPRFLKALLAMGLGAGLALTAFLLAVDGYDTVPFSPRFDREPVTSNQRFAFPALARKEKFDSAIIGTSTTRLFRPRQLDPLFGARFVNLSMNDATAWEQARIFSVFQRAHPRPRAVIIGIDAVWCAVGDDFRKLTPRPFPAWMYDDDPWNDLANLFNLPALQETGRQFAYLTGLRKPKYGKDGYTNFLPPDQAYDLKRAQLRIYGPGGPAPPSGPVNEPVSDAEARSWRFAMHPLMQGMLASLPRETVKLLAVVPYHIHNQPPPGSRAARQWQECKARLAVMAGAAGNGHVVDFMIESPLTTRDANYWDPLHFTTAISDVLAAAMAEATREKRDRPGLFRYLGPSG
jgi:hypothetical protein